MSTQAVRTITLYATKGGKKAKLETNVTTWKELKSLAKGEGYDVDKLLSTENVTRHDLVNDEALLPEGPFTLFMRPKQVKSGNRGAGLSYKDIKAAIKEDFANYPDAAAAHYNQEKNYTTKGTEVLRDLLSSFVAPSDKKVKEEVKEAASEVPTTQEETTSTPVKTITNADRAGQINVLLSEIIANASSEDVKDRADEIKTEFMEGLLNAIDEDTDATVTNVADVVDSVAKAKEEPKESAEDKAKREAAEQEAAEKAEAKRIEDEENAALAEEAKKFS